MKFKLSFLIFITLLSFKVTAQETQIGGKTGLNFSNLSGADDASMRFSGHVGGKMNIYVKDKMSVQPEIYASWQGAKLGDTKVNFTYLNIPVLYKYYVKHQIVVFGGLQMGLLLSAKFKGDEGKQFAKNQFSSTDFAFVLGGEYYINENISAELRYNLGLTNLMENPEMQKIRNSVFQIGGSYYF